MQEEYYARFSILLPDSLKRKMDAVTEPIDWSAIAARAFESRVKELEFNKECEIDGAVARLREQKQQRENIIFKDGYKAGRIWALKSANIRQLQNLHGYFDELMKAATGLWAYLFETTAGQPGLAEWRIYCKIEPEFSGDSEASSNFWANFKVKESCLDEGYLHTEWVRGFAEGALAIWNSIKDKL